ncbi:MAG: ABC transporter ATP-binding protein [Polynucleobacter sp.]|nr:ABC transporter ATP-binding protein [Polynucleobacter sp.]
MKSDEILLELKDVKSSYGKVNVLRDLSFRLYQGESLAILGRNGVGKTSALKTIMGLLKCQSGMIKFEGKSINTIAPYQIPRMGVGYVPQGRGLFPNLTVRENLYLGYKKEGAPDLSDYIFERFPRLKERLDQQAGTLSGGEQQMLSIARILLMHPKIILLDEPTEGIMPILVSEIREEIKRINGAGIGILLVEQNVQTAIRLCSRILVMDKGSIIFETKTDDVRSNPEILHEHLGMHV